MNSNFPIIAGVVGAPIHNASRSGKNWLAIIEPDPTAKGGVHRRFMERAREDGQYLVKRLEVAQAIEFGADAVPKREGEERRTCRWYGVIHDMTDTKLVVEHYAGAREAMEAASLLRGVLMHYDGSGGDRRERQLEAEKAQLVERIAQIDRELVAIHIMEAKPKP